MLDPTGCLFSSVYLSRRIWKNGARVIALASSASRDPLAADPEPAEHVRDPAHPSSPLP